MAVAIAESKSVVILGAFGKVKGARCCVVAVTGGKEVGHVLGLEDDSQGRAGW